jgi:hypothetical protein
MVSYRFLSLFKQDISIWAAFNQFHGHAGLERIAT